MQYQKSTAVHGYVAGSRITKEAGDRPPALVPAGSLDPFSASARPAVSVGLADQRIPTVEDAVKLGEEIEVKVIAVDTMGRINLSRRALTDKTPRQDGPPQNRPRDRRPPRKPGDSRHRRLVLSPYPSVLDLWRRLVQQARFRLPLERVNASDCTWPGALPLKARFP